MKAYYPNAIILSYYKYCLNLRSYGFISWNAYDDFTHSELARSWGSKKEMEHFICADLSTVTWETSLREL